MEIEINHSIENKAINARLEKERNREAANLEEQRVKNYIHRCCNEKICPKCGRELIERLVWFWQFAKEKLECVDCKISYYYHVHHGDYGPNSWWKVKQK